MRSIAAIMLAAVLFAIATVARAHGDEPMLYVDQSGEDTGLCNAADDPCRTIAYALRQAGKGTEIRVAGGSYAVPNAEVLFHVISGVVSVKGGFERGDGFTKPAGRVSTLTGVPLQYRALLESRGFHVIVDRKGNDGISGRDAEKMLAVHRKLKSGATIEPCAGGMAGELPCDNVDLLGHIAFNDLRSRPAASNDIWGYVDLNSGREYVVAGFNIGTAVIDITDPENPMEVGFIAGQNSVWRDVKILQRFDAASGRWRAWAYVTTDASSDGLFIIDLSGLPHAVERVAYASDFQSNHNVFLTNTDPATGLAPDGGAQFLLLAGSNRNAGQVRAYSLSDPTAPALAQGDAIPDSFGASDTSYAHDLASLKVSDSRVSQCPNASATCRVLLDFNEENIEIWDMTDVADPVRLNPGRQQYSERGYVHSGWPTEDGQFMFVQDELDEQNFAFNTRLRIFSIADLTDAVQVGTWNGPTAAIDHNGFVRGNRYYMSNYSRGLTVLDITDPAVPVASGRIDTFPFSNDQGFVGAWGVYPYFLSGTIAISDIDSGVYLARDRSRDVGEGSLAFGSESYAAVEGPAVSLTVQRTGGSAGSASVDYEIVHGTADATDYSTTFGTLNWASGDAADRSISLTATDDGVAEGTELLLVRLVNPTGGATLGDRHTTFVHLSDPGDATSLSAFSDAIDIDERGFARAVIVLQRSGSAVGAASIDFAAGGGDATAGNDYIGPASGTVTWPDGDANPKSIVYDIRNDGTTEPDEFFDVTLNNATGGTLTGATAVRVAIAANSAVNAAPNAVTSGNATVTENAVVTIDGGQSDDPDGDTITFQWNQTAGPAVTLTGPNTAIVTFTAPQVSSSTALQFQLQVTDAGGLSDAATVTITVNDSNSAGGGDGGGGGAPGWPMLTFLGLLVAFYGVIRTGACGRSFAHGRRRWK